MREGDIYYRYTGQSKRVAYPELSAIILEERLREQQRWFCQMSGKSKFSDKEIHSMQETARFKAADRNPYSWNMDLYLYPGGSGYEARFTKCGICTLMKELGLYDFSPQCAALTMLWQKRAATDLCGNILWLRVIRTVTADIRNRFFGSHQTRSPSERPYSSLPDAMSSTRFWYVAPSRSSGSGSSVRRY